MNRKEPQPALLISLFCLLTLAISCLSSCTNVQTKKTHSINANFVIKVKDPLLRQLTAATERLELHATGTFAPGTYDIHGTQVTVQKNTTFRFNLILPISNPTEINTSSATGELQTSPPLQTHNMSLPSSIVLYKGQVSGEVDLVRTMGSFFVNILQVQQLSSSEGGDMQQLIETMEISSANLTLRPDSKLLIGKHRFHIGPKSKVQLTNVSLDQNLNYKGTCLIDVAFAKDSAYIGEKVDTVFNGGFTNECVSVKRENSIFSLEPLAKQPLPRVTLKDCTYKFGRDKTSTAHCDTSVITVHKFDWSDNQKDDVPSFYHVDASMDLTNTHLLLNYPTYSVDAIFPMTEPATMSFYRDQTGHGVEFTTHEVLAKTGDIRIIRPTTSILLALTNAQLGKIAFTKSGDIDFALRQGTANLRAFEWSNYKKKFRLDTEGGSTISITKGTELALGKDHPGAKMQGTIPLSIKLGNASLSNGNGQVLKLSKLNGKIVVDVDKEVKIDGSGQFVVSNSGFIGDSNAFIKVQNFSLTSGKTEAVASLNGCSVVLPKHVIVDAITKELPDEKVFDLNQEILEAKQWRYKHGVIDKLTVRKPAVSNFVFSGANKATFAISGDVAVDGTIEKGGLLSGFKKDSKNWETKEWSASAPCKGTGEISYSLDPHDNLANSILNYNLKLKLPLPRDIDIDWSQVSKSLMGKAEKTVLSNYLNKCKPFQGTRSIPLDHQGTIKLFDGKNARMQSIRISKFTTKPCDSGTEIDFFGEAIL